MPCMMIGVPSHVVVDVVVRSTLCFLGRADAVAAIPRTRTARGGATFRNTGVLMLLKITPSCRPPLLARVRKNALFSEAKAARQCDLSPPDPNPPRPAEKTIRN